MTNTIKHDCTQELRDADLKITPARLGVLSALENSNKPQDISDITTYLKKNSVKADQVTVFRIINAFTEKGLARPIQFNEGKLRYEQASASDHHHFICENCGDIEDISDCHIDDLEKNINNKKGLLIKRHSLEFFGLCKLCQL
ncbi:MAG TPA: Fur family transcriptional regulator [Candidatus Limnocylindrales bacterium]|nr:Fur family transcriptional regulator [Candidatus Limnocylindrales bacterium]